MNNVEVVKGTNEYTDVRRHSEYRQRKKGSGKRKKNIYI